MESKAGMSSIFSIYLECQTKIAKFPADKEFRLYELVNTHSKFARNVLPKSADTELILDSFIRTFNTIKALLEKEDPVKAIADVIDFHNSVLETSVKDAKSPIDDSDATSAERDSIKPLHGSTAASETGSGSQSDAIKSNADSNRSLNTTLQSDVSQVAIVKPTQGSAPLPQDLPQPATPQDTPRVSRDNGKTVKSPVTTEPTDSTGGGINKDSSLQSTPPCNSPPSTASSVLHGPRNELKAQDSSKESSSATLSPSSCPLAEASTTSISSPSAGVSASAPSSDRDNDGAQNKPPQQNSQPSDKSSNGKSRSNDVGNGSNNLASASKKNDASTSKESLSTPKKDGSPLGSTRPRTTDLDPRIVELKQRIQEQKAGWDRAQKFKRSDAGVTNCPLGYKRDMQLNYPYLSRVLPLVKKAELLGCLDLLSTCLDDRSGPQEVHPVFRRLEPLSQDIPEIPRLSIKLKNVTQNAKLLMNIKAICYNGPLKHSLSLGCSRRPKELLQEFGYVILQGINWHRVTLIACSMAIDRMISKPRASITAPKLVILCPEQDRAAQAAEVVHHLTFGLDIRTKMLYGSYFYGGEQVDAQLRTLSEDGCDILVATPGRLVTVIKSGKLRTNLVRVVVVQETSLIFSDDFRDEVDFLLSRGSQWASPALLHAETKVILQTSCLPPETIDRIIKTMRPPTDTRELAYRTFFTHLESNTRAELELVQKYYDSRHDEIERMLKQKYLIDGKLAPDMKQRNQTIIFVGSIYNVKRVWNEMKKKLETPFGIGVQLYHSENDQWENENALDRFMRREVPVLVTTNLAVVSRYYDFKPDIIVRSVYAKHGGMKDLDAFHSVFACVGGRGREGKVTFFFDAYHEFEEPIGPYLRQCFKVRGLQIPIWLGGHLSHKASEKLLEKL